jgi:putative transposase
MRPTKRQHVALTTCVEAHRELYNAALQERRDAWRHSRTAISYISSRTFGETVRM